MAYQALYRKWRPRTFDSVVGQKDITDTLKNAIKRGTISHAFLFAGPRGTGKTSCAKIFAKALNCTNLQDGEPCNKCANCRAADNGSMPDIIEIDAASNNGVDEIRDIRDKAKYAPTQGKYKVYIIDEVHMLSIGAFNALLKTLEEPPEHVVFILATTELQKVPATIISRTQRYNFKRISKADLEKRMKYILDQEKIKYDDKALAVIAQVADGGMRDALSILDQLLSYEKGSVNYNDALQITGFAAKENIEKILLALLNKDAGNALKETQKELRSGASSKNILDELIDMATNALMISKAGGSDESGFISDELVQKIKDIPSTRYFHLITLANNALNDLRYTNQQQIPLEVFLVEASSNEKPVKQETVKTTSVNSDSDLQAEIAALKKQVVDLTQQVANVANEPPSNSSNQVFHLDTAKSSKNKKTRAEKAENEVKPKKVVKRTKHTNEQNRKQVYHVLANATKKDLETIKNVWPDLQSGLAVSERALLDVLEPVAASHDQVVMKCKYTLWFENASSDSDLMNKLTSEIEKFAKHKYDIVLVPDDDWLAVRKEFIESHKKEFLAKKKQKVSDIVQEEPEEKKEPKDDSKVIDKAKELFGDTVNIKD
ncbi:DNA polymerase III subunit gamma/tau [Lactobacillus acetotolerans]|jgi:DNA polymerase-3 subunit gamma/tau|uniref:DNA-directed DNA polymerase n=3 Tax=Lactobacillus acetotolerans TaxID=1600 RepID=A0A356VRN0_9LACO|nr:DNA polymerase III subunit gamma/tau [Lactobacillus acetotolerans]KRN42133.1 DNA-directed DNA polymerase [Lactobacillus acetotolerans DSM 20749 = JCM 3825]QFG50918.1 DNA polymerase III subunit gamma/tau [Lactobacillus acetotolerans]GGV07603.1 DNA polymerase III subunit gamma/tau [Lactobacillus acetotolerans DSM 20749 = JCM 3825]HBG90553.1 DNA polymerase III subunit gamma/tau [Lactobacillus acetotolerans]HBQ44000.1 DNA polymerase III subunit gamma/tau [Lactobacillus acetotolerans]